MSRSRGRPPTAAEQAAIAAVLDLDVARENALLRERALEIAAECEAGDPGSALPALDEEVWRLRDAYEGQPPVAGGQAGPPRSAREVARACRDLVARIDAGA
jgi:hypothetical protein